TRWTVKVSAPVNVTDPATATDSLTAAESDAVALADMSRNVPGSGTSASASVWSTVCGSTLARTEALRLDSVSRMSAPARDAEPVTRRAPRARRVKALAFHMAWILSSVVSYDLRRVHCLISVSHAQLDAALRATAAPRLIGRSIRLRRGSPRRSCRN